MRLLPLEQICAIQIGKTPSRSVSEYWGGDLPWVTIRDFAAGRTVTTTKEQITKLGVEKSGSKLIPRGTLLLSFKLSLGKRAYAGCDLFTNEAIAALQVLDHNLVDREYLYWALGSLDYERLVDRAAKGKTLNKAKLKALKVPLPPLDEQKRIAAILDAADDLRVKRRESLAQLDTFLQSTFLDMFGDPIRNPKGWDIAKIGDCVSRLTNGYVGPTRNIYQEEGIPYLLAKHVHDNELRFDGKTFIGAQFNQKNRKSILCAGDVLLVQSGHIGESAVVPASHEGHNCHAMIVITPKFHRILGEYLSFLFQAFCQIKYWNTIKTGITVPHLNCRDVKKIAISVPPIDLQRRFADIVKSVEKQKAKQRAHLEELDTLFASLQSRAFNGEL